MPTRQSQAIVETYNPPSAISAGPKRRRLPPDRLPEHFDSPHVYVAPRAVPTAGHEVGKPHFVDLAQIRVVDPVADSNDARDIQFHPAHVGYRDLGFVEIRRRSGRA